ncbi:hypothetical protein [Aminobacter sp. BE322]|uniref:hypothetical protein n=1 Tax=unclassified Aminobacter TaxID=2644704 RepID=UPI003D2447A3
MSRSRRKTPIIGITTAETDKPFKQAEHRRERRAVKAVIKTGEEPPAPKAFGNPWDGQKDGKQWIADNVPELLRK